MIVKFVIQIDIGSTLSNIRHITRNQNLEDDFIRREFNFCYYRKIFISFILSIYSLIINNKISFKIIGSK